MLFRPRYTIDTIYHLDPKQLKKMEIKAVFSDLDNTLLAWNKAETAVEMDELNQRLAKDGIRLVVISNNNAERIADDELQIYSELNPTGASLFLEASTSVEERLKNELKICLCGDIEWNSPETRQNVIATTEIANYIKSKHKF